MNSDFKYWWFRIVVSVILLMAGVMPVYCAMVGKQEVQGALDILDMELQHSDLYMQRRASKIDSVSDEMRKCAPYSSEQLRLIMELGDCYSGYLTDSALVSYWHGMQIADSIGEHDMAMQLELKLISNLPVVGFIDEAVSRFERMNIDSLPPELRVLAFESGRQMYSYIASFYGNYPDAYRKWNDKAVDMQKRLLEVIPKDTPQYLLNQGEYYYLTGKYSEAEATLSELLYSVGDDSNTGARAAHIISQIAALKNKDDEHVYYLAKSAIADVKSATREVMSLQELGVKLYELGDIDRAYSYLSIALGNAVECNASMRMLQTSLALPVIGAAHRTELERGRHRLYMVLGGMAVMMIVLGILLLVLRREMRRMKLLQQHLEGANSIKEMYMSQFLNLCTIYMDKLNQFFKIAERKISTGHTDDLYRMTKSGKFVEEQSREFYDTFDKAFLHIYPDFVEQVNALLKPDERIELRDGELLNTDLRILAFMRLGVDESTRIAQVLNYSVNTIYSYRNRLKNRAVNRENFENDIMKIGAIS